MFLASRLLISIPTRPKDRTWPLRDGDGQSNFVSRELEGVTVCALPLNRNVLDSLRPAAVGSRVTRDVGRGPSGVSPNVFTSAFKELDPIPQFKATLGEFLEARFSQSF